MEDIRISVIALINKAIQCLLETDVPRPIIYQLVLHAEQVYQPCVVGVVGQVNSGKSTFINALLRKDVTKVGITETTATINYFRYGTIGSERKAHCFWRDGQQRYVGPDFVNSLQGNDVETLRSARDIDHLEYYLHDPFLRDVTLVDTPGLQAVVQEHRQRTAEFAHLEQQLQEHHSNEIKRIGSQADAVIYLVNATPLEQDRAFLDAFQQVTQGQTRSYNSLAVMTKIDMYPDLVARRKAQASYVAGQMKHLVNTVVPVSAGLQRLLDRWLKNNSRGLKRLIEVMGQLPRETVEEMLDDSESFLDLVPKGEFYQEKWEEWLRDSSWMVFKTVAQKAVEAAHHGLDTETVMQDLYTIAGFEELKDILEKHFFERSHILRCLRILHDVRELLDDIKYPNLRDKEVEKKSEVITRILDELYEAIDNIDAQLQQYNRDFGALQLLSDHHELFEHSAPDYHEPPELTELDELQRLFGLYGLAIEDRLFPHEVSSKYIGQRQRAWREVALFDGDDIRRDVAQRAVDRYALLLKEVNG